MLRCHHYLLPFAAAAALLLAAGSAARVEVRTAAGQTLGSLVLTAEKGGVRLQGTLKGLPPGVHGMHIHESGRCEAPDFKSAGGHFNPGHKQHGDLNPLGAHAGDLGNITVDASGAAAISLLAPGSALDAGPGSLFPTGGTTLVIHAGPDDRKSDPAGLSGDRLACGSILR